MPSTQRPLRPCSRPVAALALLLATGTARAAAPAPDAEAVVSFDLGRKLMAERRFEEAAARFEESVRHGRTVGALLNLGRCDEELGRAASAWASYRAAASLARELHDSREGDANRFADAVKDRRSTLTLDVAALDGIAGVRVKRDGIEVGASARGEAAPVDPGDHVVDVSAPGRVAWHGTAHVGRNGDMVTLRVPELAVAPADTRDGDLAPQAAAGSSLPRTLGWVALGVGAVGVGVGAVSGGFAIAKHHDATAACTSYPDHCSSTGAADAPNAASQSWATASTVGFIAGGALMATGIVLLVAAPRGERARTGGARVTPIALGSGAGVALGGAW